MQNAYLRALEYTDGFRGEGGASAPCVSLHATKSHTCIRRIASLQLTQFIGWSNKPLCHAHRGLLSSRRCASAEQTRAAAHLM